MAEKEKQYNKYTKQKKAIVIFGIVWLVLFVISVGGRLAISPNSPLYYSYAYMIMPKSVETTFEEKDLTLYIEKNKDFNKKENQPLEAWKVYYYQDNDTSKEKIYLKNGSTLEGEKEQSNMMVLQFIGSATITDGIIRGIFKKIIIVLCILLIPYLVYVWYISWSIRYDKNKALNHESDKE